MDRLHHYTLLHKTSYKTRVVATQTSVDIHSGRNWNTGKATSKYAGTFLNDFFIIEVCTIKTLYYTLLPITITKQQPMAQ
jgi:hypothetical protein